MQSTQQAALADVTALTDDEIDAMVQTLWPVLVQAFGGEAAGVEV